MNNQLDLPMSHILNTSPPLQISTATTALLVVDMQYFDAHPDWGEGRTAKELGVAHYFDDYFDQINDIIPRIQQLLALFRSKEMEVIHIHVAELSKDSRDVGWKQLVRGLIVPADSREADFLDEIVPLDDELIISKSSSGVFPVTNIDRLLRNMGITTLIFTGTSTGGCVESAVRDAVDLGYDVVVVSDACASGTIADHKLALQCMAGGLTRILSTAEITDLVSVLETGSRKIRSGLERVKPYLPSPPQNDKIGDVNPYDLIFPPAIELSLSKSNTALVLIDAQRLTCDPKCGLGKLARAKGQIDDLAGYYERVQQALDSMQKLLQTCREQEIQIIHIRTAGYLSDGRDLSRKTRSQGICFGLNSPEAEIMPTLIPKADEIVLNKPASSIFNGTGLDELLRNLDLEHLIISGISYDGAVESSIRSTTDRGYGAVVAPDACATYHQLLQENLSDLESGIIRIKSTGEIVSQLETLS